MIAIWFVRISDREILLSLKYSIYGPRICNTVVNDYTIYFIHVCVVAPEQVTDVQVTPRCVFTGLSTELETCGELITVRFTPSTSPDILHYVVNCSENTCEPMNFRTNNDDLPASPETNTVIVYAVNRCGQTSPITTSNVTFPCQCEPGMYLCVCVTLSNEETHYTVFLRACMFSLRPPSHGAVTIQLLTTAEQT